MADRSTLFFGLRSNAAALIGGPGVPIVRRRILTAALLHDRVILEPGVYRSWAGEGGSSSMMDHGARLKHWPTLAERGQLTGARHWYALGREGQPRRVMVDTAADFSWRASFTPFSREIPSTAGDWLEWGWVTDEQPVKAITRRWLSDDATAATIRRLRGQPDPPAEHGFTDKAVVEAGYFDLATAAAAGVAVSIDRRHYVAVARRIELSGARPIGGAYALHVLLPTSFGWDDVPDLRRMPALRDYRAIVRDVEAAALDEATSFEDLERRIHAEYAARLLKASRGLSIPAKVGLAAVGFVAGAVADSAAPLVGGAMTTAAGLVADAGIERLARPRWVSVHRRVNRRPDGL